MFIAGVYLVAMLKAFILRLSNVERSLCFIVEYNIMLLSDFIWHVYIGPCEGKVGSVNN